MSEPLLRMRNIHKRFGGTQALKAVDLEIQPGQVHILAGENGAGKSTLMKILTGVHQPDQGSLEFLGKPLVVHHPKEAQLAGIAMIYQEFNLALHLPVHSNVFLGHEIKQFGMVDTAAQRRISRELFNLLDADVDPDIPVSQLGVAQRQMVEIARALSVDAKLIIMDEPTAALSDKETKKLFESIKRLQKKDVGIFYISHYLEEFGELGGIFTVLRDGEVVGGGSMKTATHDEIIQLMVGRKIDELYPKNKHDFGEVQFEVKNINSTNGTTNTSFEVQKGEIVGIAGLVGAGRTELLRAVFGLDKAQMDALNVNGVMVVPPNPEKLTHHNVGLLSEDRAGEGLAQDMTIATNITLPVPEKISLFGIINHRRENLMCQELIRNVGIKAENPNQKINQLSGGNQQKVAIARLVGAEAKVLLLDEPTRGVDVGSKVEIYRIIDELVKQGKSVVMVSSYLPELFGMCDSIYVMAKGQLSKKYAINEIDEDGVMALATGVKADTAMN